MKLPNDLCRRAFEFASRELDGDLAEFERTLLRAHVSSCERCRAMQYRLTAQTLALRGAELEPLPRPISLPARSGAFGRLVPVAAAAAAVVAVGIGGLVMSVRGGNSVAGEALSVRAPFAESTSGSVRQRQVALMNANMPASRAADAMPDTKSRFNAS